MEFHVYESARAACEAAGVLIAAQVTRKGDSVLGLATGSTPIPAYEMLTQWYNRGVIDFDRVRTFNLDEYVGIDHKNPLSYHAFMQEHLFRWMYRRMTRRFTTRAASTFSCWASGATVISASTSRRRNSLTARTSSR